MLNRFGAFVTGITACYKYIQRIKSMEMTELGLKGTHVMCIFYLHHHPEGLTAAELCQFCGEDKAAISRTLAELENKGCLYTETADGKKYRARLFLTPAGTEQAQRIDSLIAEWVSVGGDGLSEQDRADFYRILGLIAENLKEHYNKN